jgi:probable addiction module antidote protein
MGEKLTTYDPAEDLLSDEAIAVFMEEAFKTEDAGYIAHALGVVARAKGMTQIAKDTGLSREQLYRSFSANGNPTLKTTIAVMKALGIELAAKPTPNEGAAAATAGHGGRGAGSSGGLRPRTALAQWPAHA